MCSPKVYNSQTIEKVLGNWDYPFSKPQGMCRCPELEGYFCSLVWRRRHGSEQEILPCGLSVVYISSKLKSEI